MISDGWLVGSWELDSRRYAGERVSIPGEAHFVWALEGRAIQDVWIMPSRGPDEKHVWNHTARVGFFDSSSWSRGS